jgi:hypothetical protein
VISHSLDAARYLKQPRGLLAELDLSPRYDNDRGRHGQFLFTFPTAKDFEGREYDGRYRGAYAAAHRQARHSRNCPVATAQWRQRQRKPAPRCPHTRRPDEAQR